ncbi:MAG: MFS transporter [Thermoleophilia bacterium]|nr:MFS transporter [Thermoleophilia bacterium]
MRRLLAVVSVTVFADAMLFSAIVPLVPVLSDTYDLSKTGAGVLVAAYGAGAVVAGIPSGVFASRIGPKRTVVIGLLVLAVSTLAFSLGESAAALGAARFAQGVASAITWCGALAWLTLATPRDQRGKAVGTVFSIAVLGFIVGPAIGAIAELTSLRGTFMMIAGLTVLVALFAASSPAGQPEEQPPEALRRILKNRGFFAALWLVLVPSLFLGVLDLLVPLSLDDANWGTIAIAATFIAAGLSEVILAPLIGSFSDRRGRLVPVRAGLLLMGITGMAFAALDTAYAIAALVIVASIAASLIFSPSAALISDRGEEAEIPQTLAFGFMNTAWAGGVMLGPVLGGAIADALGDAGPYVLGAALAFITAGSLRGVTSTRGTVAEPAADSSSEARERASGAS